MISPTLTPWAKKVLSTSGWYEGRCIDVTTIEEVLTHVEFLFFDQARQFVQEFGNLCVNHICTRWFHRMIPFEKQFDTYIRKELFSSVEMVLDDLVSYERCLGKHLCFVGDVYGNTGELYIRTDGRMYAVNDQYVLFLGESIYESINNLCVNRFVKKLTCDFMNGTVKEGW